MTATTFKKTAIGKKYWTRRIIAPSLRNIAAEAQSLEETMSRKIRISNLLKTAQASHRWMRLSTLIPAVCFAFPIAALAQGGSPFDTGFTSIQTLFTGTIAKVASLVAIVIGGYGFAHGEPGAKKLAS
jgi:type IV secretion system protein VirB2